MLRSAMRQHHAKVGVAALVIVASGQRTKQNESQGTQFPCRPLDETSYGICVSVVLKVGSQQIPGSFLQVSRPPRRWAGRESPVGRQPESRWGSGWECSSDPAPAPLVFSCQAKQHATSAYSRPISLRPAWPMMLSVAMRLALSIAEVMATISSWVGGSAGRTRVTGMRGRLRRRDVVRRPHPFGFKGSPLSPTARSRA